MIKHPQWKANILLFLTSLIWGFAFVFQREGMDYIGPFTFNGVRFALGALSLVPLILFMNRKNRQQAETRPGLKTSAISGVFLGVILFAGSTFQQIGLIYTTAGKAAFITSLYMVIVPFLGLFLKQRLNLNNWVGAFLALIGMFFLCVTDRFILSNGDGIEMLGAIFWALQILAIDRLSRKTDVLLLSFFQIITCSILSLTFAVVTEKIQFASLMQVLIPLLYGGVGSVGIAYTLQVVGQKNAQPTQAAIIFSMESVFAALGGFLMLHEHLGTRGFMGCLLMFAGLIFSQLPQRKFSEIFTKRHAAESKHTEV